MGIIETLKMQARREGLEQGRLERLEQGRCEVALEIAREMKKDKFTYEKIAKITKLSLKEIEGL